MSHTPTPWGWEKVDTQTNYSHCTTYEIVDSKGNTIVDCLNSEVAVIECDPDENGSNYWDEQGRQDIEFILKACNFHDALVEALDQMVKAVVEPSMISMGFDHPPEYASEADHWLAKAIFDARNLLASIKGEKKQ